MKTIGLTGGIGAGKSKVSDYLLQKGYIVVDADHISREVTAPGTEGLADLTRRFGTEILSPDGTLDRKRLAGLVFSDAEKRRLLNETLHGRIGRRMDALLAEYRAAGARTVFLSVPLLIEAGMQEKVDEIWLVDADEAVRVRRVEERDACTAEAVRKRIAAQMPAAEKEKYAAAVIRNSGSEAELYERLDALIRERL
jgi:dephospho-CoA kinase